MRSKKVQRGDHDPIHRTGPPLQGRPWAVNRRAARAARCLSNLIKENRDGNCEEVGRQEGAREEGNGEEGCCQEGSGEEGRGQEGRCQEGAGEEGCGQEGREEGRGEEGPGEEGCSQEGPREEGGGEEGCEEARCEEGPCGRCACGCCCEAGRTRCKDHAEPASGLALPDRREAL